MNHDCGARVNLRSGENLGIRIFRATSVGVILSLRRRFALSHEAAKTRPSVCVESEFLMASADDATQTHGDNPLIQFRSRA